MAAAGPGPGGRPAADPAGGLPHYLISAVPPTLGQRTRLLALAQARHQSAAGYLLAGDVPGSSWTWEVTAQGRLLAGLLGLDVQAQLLPAQQYDAVMELFDTAGLAGRAPRWPRPPRMRRRPSSSTGPGHAGGHRHPRPDLGARPGSTRTGSWPGLATRVVAFLAMIFGWVHRNAVEAAIWP